MIRLSSLLEVLFAVFLWWTFQPASWFYHHWTMTARVWLIVLLILQTYTVIDLYRRERRTKALLRGILQDAADAMEDTLREPGDNTPYERYRKPGVMHPLDQAAWNQLKPREESGDGTAGK